MFETLQIVRGAVSKERLVPVLSHFAFRNETVCGFNGRVYISAPAPGVPFNFTVPARPFLTAYDAMTEEGSAEEVALVQQGEDRLRVSRGELHVTLPTGPVEAFPFTDPGQSKKRKRVPHDFLATLTALRPFVGEDASVAHAWSTSVKVVGAHALATNNVSLISLPISAPRLLPSAVLPVQLVDELLRIAQPPTHLVQEHSSLTFFLPNEAWVHAPLPHDAWPSALDMLDAAHTAATPLLAPCAAWADAVRAIRPFCPDPKHEVVVFEGEEIRTLEGDVSARVKGFEFEGRYTFHIAPLLAVLDMASHVDFSNYPRVAWCGEGEARGLLLGLVQP